MLQPATLRSFIPLMNYCSNNYFYYKRKIRRFLFYSSRENQIFEILNDWRNLASTGNEVGRSKMAEKRNQLKRRTPYNSTTPFLVILYIISFATQSQCETVHTNSQNITKNIDNLDIDTPCHRCQTSNVSLVEEVINTIGTFTKEYILVNKTDKQIENEFESVVDDILSKDKYEIFDGVEIKKTNDTKRRDESESRALFAKYTYEYRLYQKVKDFIDTHILSINLSKAARFVSFRSFGLKKFFVPLLIGAQVFKSILLAMFLPSILGSFGKILGKGISQLSASSSQASYPPANPQMDEQGYNADPMGYETNPAGTFAYPQDGMYVVEDNDLSNVDMSRFGAGGQKVSYLPTRNDYYKNQMGAATNNYKVFQKIPASSMILSNYDPFYSPLLSRLDGIFARLGLAPSENAIHDSGMQIGGQSLSDVKLESCREQLICFMYASPAKYAPYSNLISAQLSRELNELRRPVSDNPEILRFFRYMRAARRGQEGADCARIFPACVSTAAPQHAMIAAYHDINKLVTARKLH